MTDTESSTSEDKKQRRPPSLFKKILLLISFTVFALLFGDWLIGRIITLRASKDDSPQIGRKISPAMYLMTEIRQDEATTDPDAPIKINANGFRHPSPLAMPKTKPRIFVIGGSFAMGLGATSDDAYYLSYLKRANPEMEIVCAGSGGYVANQQWIHLGLKVMPLAPDGIIILDGLNDINLPLVFGQPIGAPWQWNEYKGFMDGTFRGYLGSTIKTRSQIYRLASRFHLNTQEKREAFKTDTYPAVVEGYRHATTLTYDTCRARDIPVWHVFQPQLAVDKPKTEEEKRFMLQGLGETMQELYPRFALATAENAKKHDAPFYDFSGCFKEVGETVYVDYCHLNDAGHKLFGEKLAQVLSTNKAWSALARP